MPYRINPNNKKQVQVLKEGRWKLLKGGNHATQKQAKSHLFALNKNVRHKK